MAQRFVIAMMKHETNTFSPIRTDWRRFEEWGAYFGADARRAYDGTAMPFGAYLKLAGEVGAEVVTPVAAEAMPSGPVQKAAYETMVTPILEAVREGCDAAFLDLHGAMVAETTPDGEGALLESPPVRPDRREGVGLVLHHRDDETARHPHASAP